MSEIKISAIILAGGRSKRMGKDKAFLTLGEKTFIRIIGERLSRYCTQIVVSGNKDKELYQSQLEGLTADILFVKDRHPYAGPLNGIASCMEFVNNEFVFIATCDTPLLEPALIPFFLKEIEECEGVIPVALQKQQFLNTLYRKKAIEKSEKLYLSGVRSLREWINELEIKQLPEEKLRKIDEKLYSYWSINTPADYTRLLSLSNIVV